MGPAKSSRLAPLALLALLGPATLTPASGLRPAPAAAPSPVGGVRPALTPPRGWRSFNCFKRAITQPLILEQARILAGATAPDDDRPSLLSLGFDRIGIDGGWMACGSGVDGSWHSAAGQPLVNRSTFPDLVQMNAEAHALGVKMGFYMNDCWCSRAEKLAWNATGGHPAQDSALVIDSHFDGVKIDGCGPAHNISAWYTALSTASPRPLMIENCGNNHATRWSPPQPSEVRAFEGNCPYHMYRISRDIAPNFYSTMFNLQSAAPFLDRAEPASSQHCWAYPDMYAPLFCAPVQGLCKVSDLPKKDGLRVCVGMGVVGCRSGTT